MIEEQLEINKTNIQTLIYQIRGKQVMLDSDVAELYQYETRILNQTVKRNIDRFPLDFCFKLTKDEYEQILKIKPNNSSQIVMSSTYKHRAISYLPYAFTEQGIAMLSGLLKNEIAIKVSINIMRAFIEMRKFIFNNANMFERLTTVEYKLLEQDKKIDNLFNLLQKDDTFKEKIFYNGQIYDAYSLLIKIIKKANKNIIIIDNYVDKTVLDILTKKKINVDVKIITNKFCELSIIDINKFNEQYPKLKIEYSNEYHDRFIILDDISIFHCGASFKDLGKKCFAIAKLEDKSLISKMIINK